MTDHLDRQDTQPAAIVGYNPREVEAIARAIYESSGGFSWETLTPNRQDRWFKYAVAALEAIERWPGV